MAEQTTRTRTSAERAKQWRERQARTDPAFKGREAARLRAHRKRQAEQRAREPIQAREGSREPWESDD